MISFLLAVILLLVFAKALGEIMERLGLPALLGELLAGIVLGAAVLGWVEVGPLESLALLGIILLLFLVGFNFSIERLKKEGKVGVVITMFGFLFVLIPSYFLLKSFGFGLLHAIFFSLIMGGESTPNTIKTIVDLKQLKSRVSHVIISATVVEDFIFYTILAFTVAVIGATGITQYAVGLGKIALFFLLFFVMERASPYLIRFTERMRAEEAQFAMGFVLILALAYAADALGFASVVGAFFAGIALAYSPYLKAGSFSPKIAAFTFGVFSPLFFGWMGLQVEPQYFLASMMVFALIALGIVAKLVGNIVGGMVARVSFRDSLGAAIGLSTRGGEQLLILVIAAQLGVFGSFVPQVLIPVTILAMVFTIFVSPVLLKLFFRKYGEQ